MSIGNKSGWENIWLRKCLVEKLSFFFENMSVGKMSFEKMSLGNCRLGKTRVEKLSFGKLSEIREHFRFDGLLY